MSRRVQLYDWGRVVASRLPKLSRSQAAVLALYSFGMVLAHGCGLSAVCLHLARLLLVPDNTVRQRLREFCLEAPAKRGRKRLDLDPSCCFPDLLAWVTADWSAPRLAVALDPTTLGDRLTVLCVSVLYRGCAIPVAWKVLAGNQPQAWNPHWQRLLGLLADAVPAGWDVLVLSDRGLESRALFEAITAVGWHPLMRVKAGGGFRPEGWSKFYPLARFAGQPGRRWAGAGQAYQKAEARLCCTLLACWEQGHQDRWLILTDLGRQAARPCWYAFRAWIEQGFKVVKSAGWQWQRTRMTEPGRCERRWLVVAVATLWVVAVGGQVEADAERETVPPLPKGGQRRLHRVFAVGLAEILAQMGGGLIWVGRFEPEPWPEGLGCAVQCSEAEFCRDQTYP